MKTTYINELKPGDNLRDVFLIAEAKQLTARNGPYWSLTLKDNSGTINARIWSPASANYPDLSTGTFALVQGQVDSYNNVNQINVHNLAELDPEAEGLDMADFLPTADTSTDELYEGLVSLAKEHLTHKPWSKFCLKVLKNEEIKNRLMNAPGAKTVHHAYLGGLMEHTLAVSRLCMSIADLYPGVDRQVLLAAALFHDLGKAWELSSGPATDYTDTGRLLGHIYIGLEILEPFLKKAKDLDEDLKLHFKHIILSHHGEYEFGSPRRPKTPEAFILHYADNLDAKLKTIGEALDTIPDDGGNWTGYQRFLERYLFKAAHTPEPETNKKSDKADMQCSLPLKG